MRNHGVSRIHRPSTDHRSVFDLGLINERSPRPHVQSLRGSAQPSADAGSAIRPARPQKSQLVGASYGRVCGVSRRGRADTRSPVRGPSPAGAGGQSRKSGPRRPAASVGIAAHAISGELRFCPRRRTLLATAPLLHGAGCRGGSRAPWPPGMAWSAVGVRLRGQVAAHRVLLGADGRPRSGMHAQQIRRGQRGAGAQPGDRARDVVPVVHRRGGTAGGVEGEDARRGGRGGEHDSGDAGAGPTPCRNYRQRSSTPTRRTTPDRRHGLPGQGLAKPAWSRIF